MNKPFPRVRISGPFKWTSSPSGHGTIKHVENRLLVRDVVRIVFFVPYDHVDIAPGVEHALNTYVRAVEGHASALSRYVCCHWESYRLGDRGWELIRETLEPKERRYVDDYEPDEAFEPMKYGADPYFVIYGEQDSGYCFDYHARLPWREAPPGRASVLRVTLPTEYLEERGPDFVRELALDMTSRLPISSGHVGLALECEGAVYNRLDPLRPVMFRHPGFDLRGATIHDDLGTRVDGVHWMNFLGQPVLGELGGATVLRARLLPFPTCTVQELAGERALVTLGACPEAGDLTEGHTLPAYRELARVLEPWQEPFPWGFLGRQNRNTEEEELRRWWRRFLD
jgi:hypothetical protein